MKPDDASTSTSDKGTAVTTYVRVGRGMVKVTKYEKQDRDKHEGSIHSFDSSQPVRAPSVKSASSHNRAMPSWVPKFKKKKSKKNLGEDKHDSLAPPVPAMPTPPLSPDARPLRAAHSYNDLTQATPTDMWESITQLESELVARYGRGAVPQFEALRDRVQQIPQQSLQPQPQPRTRTETLPSSRTARTLVSDLDVYPQLQPEEPEEPEDDSEDGAAYLEALGIEAPEKPKAKFEQKPRDTVRQPHPVRSATLPPEYSQAALGHPSPEMLEHYATTRRLPRSDYVTTQLGLAVDTPRSLSPYSPPVDTPESPPTPGRRRNLPARPAPPSTYPPSVPTPPLNVSRSAQSSPALRPQASLTVPSPHTPRSPQLSLPLVRVRITSPPNRGALRALPALILLTPQAKATFAAATWAQMVTYCARNAGVSIARRGGGGNLLISIEERMADVISPGGGRGVGDEEVGFGLGYYVSVEMNLEEDGPGEGGGGESVPVARLEVPLPTTLGEIASVFRERKDIRKALS